MFSFYSSYMCVDRENSNSSPVYQKFFFSSEFFFQALQLVLQLLESINISTEEETSCQDGMTDSQFYPPFVTSVGQPTNLFRSYFSFPSNFCCKLLFTLGDFNFWQSYTKRISLLLQWKVVSIFYSFALFELLSASVSLLDL